MFNAIMPGEPLINFLLPEDNVIRMLYNRGSNHKGSLKSAIELTQKALITIATI